MWDVKKITFQCLCPSLECFTLTMWDVKLIIAIGMLENVQTFYLNYVGCKGDGVVRKGFN